MRIPSLVLTGFRSYDRALVTFDTPITFVIGRNGFGKSTLIDAVQWCLTGRCRGTDARGAGGDTLIRNADPAGSMRVQVRIQDADGHDHVVERTQTAKASTLSVDGGSGSKDAQMGAFYAQLGVTPAIVDACLQSDAFLALHHAEAKKLLLDVLDVRIDVAGETLTLNQLEAKYQQWFEVRRTRKAAFAAIVVPPKPDGEIPNLEAIEAQLAALRDGEKQLLSAAAEASGAATGRRGEIEKQLGHVQGALVRTHAAIAESATTAALDGAKVDLDDALMETEERLGLATDDEADDDADRHRMTLVDAQGRLKMLTDTHQAIGDHNPDRGCVLNGAIPCKTPAKAFMAELGKLQGQIDALTAEAEQASKEVEKARLRHATRAKLSTRLETLRAMASKRAGQLRDRDDLMSTEARLRSELDACPVAAAASPELVTLQQRIARGEAVVRTARDVVGQAALHESRTVAKTEASKALAEAEAWVEQLGPNGVRVQALSQALDQFQADINGSLDRFGYRLQFIADPWLVLVNDLPAELLSTSERLRVGIALQLALAEATGFNVVAIDQVDLLDAGNRAVLGELLSLRGRVQVLAAATKDEDWKPPAIEGWTWYRVEKVDGVSQVQRCEPLTLLQRGAEMVAGVSA